MSSNRKNPVTIRQYLLGQLTGDGLERFEQQLFSDDELFENLLATEDELIEESLAGDLNEDEAEWFARYFLITPERQQKLRFRESLRRYVVKNAPKTSVVALPVKPAPIWRPLSWVSWATAAVAALVILGAVVSLLVFHFQRPQQRTIAELTLTSGPSDRAAGAVAQRVKSPLQVDDVKLHLLLADQLPLATDYRVELLAEKGTPKILRPVAHDAKSVDLIIPASELSRGQYALNVYAILPGGTEQRIRGSYLLTVD